MSETRTVDKNLLTVVHNPRNPRAPMEWGERGIRDILDAKRATARKAAAGHKYRIAI